MSKITKKDRIAHLEFQVAWLTDAVHELQGTENLESEPQLKQLDQSIFDGLYEKWRFAAVDEDGSVAVYLARPICNYLQWYVEDKSLELSYKYFRNKKGYDTSNWQNSLIERDIAKELTGSDLARAMLARGDKFILCGVSDSDDSDAANHEDDDFLAEAVTDFDDTDGLFGTTSMRWNHAIPINNQGEPLTASEVGL